MSGESSYSSADALFVGANDYDLVGYSVSGTRDVDGDGIDDVLIGAPGEDSNGRSAGAVYFLPPRAPPKP